jgi:hypothetical protein
VLNGHSSCSPLPSSAIWPSVPFASALPGCYLAKSRKAARVIGDGALLATQSRSVRLTREVQAVRARLEPWKDTQAIRELDERLVGCKFGG